VFQLGLMIALVNGDADKKMGGLRLDGLERPK